MGWGEQVVPPRTCLLGGGAGPSATCMVPGMPADSSPWIAGVQRAHYDQTGKIMKTAEEEFMDSFAGGPWCKGLSFWTWLGGVSRAEGWR